MCGSRAFHVAHPLKKRNDCYSIGGVFARSGLWWDLLKKLSGPGGLRCVEKEKVLIFWLIILRPPSLQAVSVARRAVIVDGFVFVLGSQLCSPALYMVASLKLWNSLKAEEATKSLFSIIDYSIHRLNDIE